MRLEDFVKVKKKTKLDEYSNTKVFIRACCAIKF